MYSLSVFSIKLTCIPHRDELMRTTGLLVKEWPVVLGCDASGEVVEVGEEVTKFRVGDGVFGCTRLGFKGYGTFQEFVRFRFPDVGFDLVTFVRLMR
jgi:NADPH:quinone reductase-like Zn-dependent oxidoreductase